MSKSNVNHLRDILTGMELEKTDEAIEFLDAIEEDLNKKDALIASLEDEADEDQIKLDSQAEELDMTYTVDLGLDKIHYRLEDGNLLIQQKLERAFKAINTVPHAEVI